MISWSEIAKQTEIEFVSSALKVSITCKVNKKLMVTIPSVFCLKLNSEVHIAYFMDFVSNTSAKVAETMHNLISDG